jgi:hypothetical protein
MNYWASLNDPSDAENIQAGADSLLCLVLVDMTTTADRRPTKVGIRLIEGQAAGSGVERTGTYDDDATWLIV